METISGVSGNVGVRQPPTPIELTAYLAGTVAEVMPGEGVIVQAQGALAQGIFGIGGERVGEIHVVSPSPDADLTEADITADLAGKILIGGANVSGAALRKAADLGVKGIVVGGIVDVDLIAYLGYDIGVAITGHENIPITLVITEGFGTIAMARRTYDLLASLQGRSASINGATQIRAGVIRPEVIVPLPSSARSPGTGGGWGFRGQPGRRHPHPHHPGAVLRRPRRRRRPAAAADGRGLRRLRPRPGCPPRRRPHRHRPARQRRDHGNFMIEPAPVSRRERRPERHQHARSSVRAERRAALQCRLPGEDELFV